MYSLTVKPVSRLQGESIVKVAAYQSRGRIYDMRADTAYDFSHKSDLLFSSIYWPANATNQLFESRAALWNAVENKERRYDARTGRTLWGALPIELPLEEQIRIVNEFVYLAFLPLGMCTDVAIHSGENTDGVANNPHLHILLSDRPIDQHGFCAKKDRSWNNREVVNLWRKHWEQVLNRAYERNGLDKSVSCESLEVQGTKRKATKHLGRAATEMERRGVPTDRGNENREIRARNDACREELQYQIELEKSWELELSR